VAQPPIACVHDQVADGPGLFVEEHPLDVGNLAVRSFDMIASDRLATAQMRIVTLALVGLTCERFTLDLPRKIF
jgi:hypothetical protein